MTEGRCMGMVLCVEGLRCGVMVLCLGGTHLFWIWTGRWIMRWG